MTSTKTMPKKSAKPRNSGKNTAGKKTTPKRASSKAAKASSKEATAASSDSPKTRRGLSTELIVQAACEIIAESGADKLTIRGLSERLGVALGATYHYIPNRDALLALVAQELNDRVILDDAPPKEWAQTLQNLMTKHIEVFSEYPGMSAYTLKNLDATRPVKLGDELLARLADAGFTGQHARDVMGSLFFYVGGTLAADMTHTDDDSYTPEQLNLQFHRGLDLLLKGAAVQLREDKRERRANNKSR